MSVIQIDLGEHVSSEHCLAHGFAGGNCSRLLVRREGLAWTCGLFGREVARSATNETLMRLPECRRLEIQGDASPPKDGHTMKIQIELPCGCGGPCTRNLIFVRDGGVDWELLTYTPSLPRP